LRQSIDRFSKITMGSAAVAAQAKTAAETQEASGKARESNASAAIKEIEAGGLKSLTPQSVNDWADKIYDPNSTQTGGQNRWVKGQALGALNRGDPQGAQKILQELLSLKWASRKIFRRKPILKSKMRK
jgi:hypothetical protein